jgi:lysophospholipase L1-like esterase
MKRVILAAAAALLATPAAAAPAKWVASWAASPAPAMTAQQPGPMSRFASPSFSNQTVVQLVRLSAGGKRLRIRLTNEYGAKPLAIGAARVALAGPDGKPLPGTDRAVTFSGAAAATVAPHAPLVSDPVDLPTGPLATLRIAIYFPGATGPCNCHALGEADALVSPPGDFTTRDFAPASKVVNRVFLTSVDVEGAPPGPVIVAFGDSITDGAGSTANANRRWPDVLAERLKGRAAVANAGISGNRVLSDAGILIFGESALARFDRDVLALPGATHLIVLEGVNDLGGAQPPTAEQLIAGYRQLTARAHAHGIKVIFATILPYAGANYYRPASDAVRGQVNAWIRTNREADGFVDLDAAIRDPAKPERMRADLHSGDWLHPNDAGYKVMGEAIDLKLFR